MDEMEPGSSPVANILSTNWYIVMMDWDTSIIQPSDQIRRREPAGNRGRRQLRKPCRAALQPRTTSCTRLDRANPMGTDQIP